MDEQRKELLLVPVGENLPVHSLDTSRRSDGDDQISSDTRQSQGNERVDGKVPGDEHDSLTHRLHRRPTHFEKSTMKNVSLSINFCPAGFSARVISSTLANKRSSCGRREELS